MPQKNIHKERMMPTLKIPELSLVVLVGASGSGKSTFARRHFKPTEIVSSDTCRGLISDDETDLECSEDAFDLLFYIAAKRMDRGKLTVIDATNVNPKDRAKLIKLARNHHFLPVAIVLDMDWQDCHDRNKTRPDRQFGKHVVIRHTKALRNNLRDLRKAEGFTNVHYLKGIKEIEAVTIERQPLWNNKKREHGPFDIIGDVHGCFDELAALVAKLGYTISHDDGHYAVSHPEGRKLVFLGDLVDRGPKVPEVLRFVMQTTAAEQAFCVIGNHEDKLKRALNGRKVRISHGLRQSLDQLEHEDETFREAVKKFLDGLISHYVFDDGRLCAAHAGIKEAFIGRGGPAIRQFCLYGETTGETDSYGLPVRYPWAQDYRGETLVVYGHTPIPEPEWINNTINVDTGCVFGGNLSALRYPEKEIVSVPAAQVYAEPVKPLEPPRARFALLDLDDVTGKRVINTTLRQRIQIHEENAAAALEVMSRFAIDPRWLIYLPPTMSPTQTSDKADYLEYPDQAFAYYRAQGISTVICEEKHMGSRAIVIVCRDPQTAETRFGVSDGRFGVCYTRTGRAFFSDDALDAAFLTRVRDAVTTAGLWGSLQTDWLVLDCELMPWSAKAQSLLQHQYAPVAAAAETSLSAATNLLAQAAERLPELASLHDDFTERYRLARQYRDAYRRYCWPVQGLDDYALAPFHLLAHENSFNMDKEHPWHLTQIERLYAADPGLFRRTAVRTVDLEDEAACAAACAWWEMMTNGGGEGMVVKPLTFTGHGKDGLLQPGIKCRGPEYLRIIYGPEYSAPGNLARLRERGVGKKRSLALREYALGYEALKLFVERQPLHKVHALVFAVLALESEAVDPRL